MSQMAAVKGRKMVRMRERNVERMKRDLGFYKSFPGILTFG